jgi:hypothetical protein
LFKLTGLYPGVSDLLFMYKKVSYCIEMKTPVGYMSPEQKEWRDQMIAQGFTYVVKRDLTTFQIYIEGLIKQAV